MSTQRVSDKRHRACPMVTPFARALWLLEAFTENARWLGNRDLAARSGMPASTVWRIAQSLVILGYLLYDAETRKYRLAPSVLALGYGAVGHAAVQLKAHEQMQGYADLQSVQVTLGTRERLEIVTLDSVSPALSRLPSDLPVSVARASLASSPMGWALLSALPESERNYLMHKVERRAPQDGLRMRRRIIQAMAQVREAGYCSSVSEWHPDLGIVAAPVLCEGRAPRVISCVGHASRITSARVQRELGPRLLALAAQFRQSDIHA